MHFPGDSNEKRSDNTQSTLASINSGRSKILEHKLEFDDSSTYLGARSIFSSVCSSIHSSFRLRKPKTPLLRLAEQQKFDEIAEILLDNKRYNYKSWLDDCSDRKRGKTALHLVLQHRPPARVVNMIVRRMKEDGKDTNPLTVQDNMGKTPMHVAVSRACDVLVIELMLRGAMSDNPAAIADNCQRYPLHWACANPYCLIKPMVSMQATDKSLENMVRVISSLVVACPIATDAKDVNGWTPAAMAKYHKADLRIMCILESTGDMVKQDQRSIGLAQATMTASTVPEVDIPFEILAQPKCSGGNFDSMSTLGWEDTPRGIKLFEWQKTSGIDRSHEGRDILVSKDPLNPNSSAVIKQCWFL